jgi:hypothetical protein
MVFGLRLTERGTMTFKGWIATATLVLLVPIAVSAATEANFDAKSTGDLVASTPAIPPSPRMRGNV